MQCPKCGSEVADGNHFCIQCGEPLTHIPQQTKQSGNPDESNTLEDEVRNLEEIVSHLSRRIASLELLRNIQQSTQHERPLGTINQATPGLKAPDLENSHSTPKDADTHDELVFQAKPKFFQKSREDWERVLGMNWLAIVGALALAIGVAFFMTLAIDRNWVGPTGRVVIGIVFGIMLLGIGEYTQRRYTIWAHAVSGAGISILYLSIYASIIFFQIISPMLAFLLLALIVVLGGLLALRYNSRTIAILGILGAFLIPTFIDLQHEIGPYTIAIYIMIVDLGVLAISSIRNWRWLILIALVGSYLVIGEASGSGSTIVFHVFSSIVFLIFVGSSTIFHVVWRHSPGRLDLTIMILNAFAYYGITFGTIGVDDGNRLSFGLITVGLALLYGAVGYVAVRLTGPPSLIALYSFGISIIFFTIAIPVSLTGSWIAVTWAAEAVILIWFGFFLNQRTTRSFGLGIFILAILYMFYSETQVNLEEFRLLTNDRFLVFGFLISCLYVGSYLYWRGKSTLRSWENRYIGVHIGIIFVANLLTLGALSLEIVSYFEGRLLTQDILWQDAENSIMLSLTVLWAIYAFGLIFTGIKKDLYHCRWTGLLLLLVTVSKLLMIDTFTVNLNPATFIPLWNPFCITLILVTMSVVLTVRLCSVKQNILVDRSRGSSFANITDADVMLAMTLVIGTLTIWGISTEIIRFFDSRAINTQTDLSSAKHMTLTLVWTAYSISVIGIGIYRDSSKIRLAGLLLLVVPVLKLFVFDIFLLEQLYRVIGFIALGVLLLTTGLIYQWHGQAIRGFLFGTRG